jgi:hypothetical protein
MQLAQWYLSIRSRLPLRGQRWLCVIADEMQNTRTNFPFHCGHIFYSAQHL